MSNYKIIQNWKNLFFWWFSCQIRHKFDFSRLAYQKNTNFWYKISKKIKCQITKSIKIWNYAFLPQVLLFKIKFRQNEKSRFIIWRKIWGVILQNRSNLYQYLFWSKFNYQIQSFAHKNPKNKIPYLKLSTRAVPFLSEIWADIASRSIT